MGERLRLTPPLWRELGNKVKRNTTIDVIGEIQRQEQGPYERRGEALVRIC